LRTAKGPAGGFHRQPNLRAAIASDHSVCRHSKGLETVGMQSIGWQRFARQLGEFPK
jgi:hypothetical protein